MKTSGIVHSQEIINLISSHPRGIMQSQLIETVASRFGESVKFQTGSLMGMDLDDVLVFLEARNKLRIVRGVVFPCSSPAYAG